MTYAAEAITDALVCMAELEAGARREITAYAHRQFLAGRSVRYCHGPGFGVIECGDHTALKHALDTGRRLN